MDDRKFQIYMAAAKTEDDDYARGYQRGLRRHHHGERFGSDDEHALWMSFSGHRQELGDGYRDGFAGRPPKWLHGNAGNTNAQRGDDLATAVLHVRCTPEQKSGWVKRAQSEGMKLSEWVIARLT